MSTKVGFIGLGNMGFPMAKNLTDDAFELTVHDVAGEPMEALAGLGATVAANAREVAERSSVIGICVRDDADTDRGRWTNC